jgi:hypothetical protein
LIILTSVKEKIKIQIYCRGKPSHLRQSSQQAAAAGCVRPLQGFAFGGPARGPAPTGLKNLNVSTAGGKIGERQKGERMKRTLKILSAIIITALIIPAIYCVVIVTKARLDTPGIITRVKAGENIKLKLSDFSQWQIDALLKVEDPAFYSHKGVDLKTPGAGITTITQGLVKKLYFKDFKPGFAKLKQTLIARFVLDPMVSKEEQLVLFVNITGLGRCREGFVNGFYDAAGCYFGKKVKDLTKDEYLSLVAMIIAPVNFGLQEHPDANAERVKRIKALLNGKYEPKGLMDIYYGALDKTTQEGLAPASYFEGVYKK